MKTLEEMTKEELYQLCIELMLDSAEVQGVSIEDYAERFYKIKW